jgi:DNA-binding PadR family transcriptional regulator
VGEVNATAAALLGFLMREPMTGWQIAQSAQAELCDYWNLNRSHVYRELAKLTDAGLVEAGAKGVREQVPYTITPAGTEAFLSWLREDPGPEIMRSPIHLKLAFAEYLDDERCARFVRIARRRTEERLEYYRDVERRVDAARPNLMHVLRSGIEMREAMLRWLDGLPWSTESSHRRRSANQPPE